MAATPNSSSAMGKAGITGDGAWCGCPVAGRTTGADPTVAVACNVTVWPSSSVTVAVIDLVPAEAYVWVPLTLNAPLEIWLTVPDDDTLSPQLIVAAKSATFACAPAASLKLPTAAVKAFVVVAVRLLS